MSSSRPWTIAAMVVPTTRVMVRTARNVARRRPASLVWTTAVDGTHVQVPVGHTGAVAVAGDVVGRGDVRHDHGSSTLEVWTALHAGGAAATVLDALTRLARETGARRLAWSLQPGSAEQVAAAAAGMTREGAATPPVGMGDTPHEQWALVLTRL